MNSDLRNAYHEAGHTACAKALGADFFDVRIDSTGGRCYALFRDETDKRRNRAFTAAGAVAEYRFMQIAMPQTLENNPDWKSDALSIRCDLALSYRVGTEAYNDAYQLTMLTASLIVSRNWTEIGIIARALVAHRTLYADDVDRLVRVLPMDCCVADPVPDTDPLTENEVQAAERLLRAHNERNTHFQRAFRPNSFRGNHPMSAHLIESSDIGRSGSGRDAQTRIASLARETQAAVLAGKVARTSQAATAARDTLDLIGTHRTLGAPLLTELERRMTEVAA